MKLIRRFILKRKIRKDQRFLMIEGVRKAKIPGLKIDLDDEMITLKNSKSMIEANKLDEKYVDIREIISLIADDFPE